MAKTSSITTSDDEDEFHDAVEEFLLYNDPEEIERLFDGEELVVSHIGASQYARGGGVAACGLAALNCARIILGMEECGARNGELLKGIMHRKTVEDITSICSSWSSDAHLEVEDIYEVPIFQNSLELRSTQYARPNRARFESMLSKMQTDTRNSAVVIITRPPEIIACFKLATSRVDVFMIFDSHPRPGHPDGSGFTFNISREATALHLSNLLPVDENLLEDDEMQWETQLLANFSAHLFVSKHFTNDLKELTKDLLGASLTILELQAEVHSLGSDPNNMRTEMERQERVHLEEKKAQQTRLRVLEGEIQHLQAEITSRDEQFRDQQLSYNAERKALLAENQHLQSRLKTLEQSNRKEQARMQKSSRHAGAAQQRRGGNHSAWNSPPSPGPSRFDWGNRDTQPARPDVPPTYSSGFPKPGADASPRGLTMEGPKYSRDETDHEMAERLRREWEERDSGVSPKAAGKRRDWGSSIRSYIGSYAPPSGSSPSGNDPFLSRKLPIPPPSQVERNVDAAYLAAARFQIEMNDSENSDPWSNNAWHDVGGETNLTRPPPMRGPPSKNNDTASPFSAPPSNDWDDPEDDFMIAAKMQIAWVQQDLPVKPREPSVNPPVPAPAPTPQPRALQNLENRPSASQTWRKPDSTQNYKWDQPKPVKLDQNTRSRTTRGLDSPQTVDRGLEQAFNLQREFSEEDKRLRAEKEREMFHLHLESQNLEAVAALQREFEEEDRRLQAERAHLAGNMQQVFECGVCLEEHPIDSVARVDVCEHEFCRECMRGYIESKLGEHRFPILCPGCSADAKSGEPGMITQPLVEQVSIPEKYFATFIELQMVTFSILLDCRKCNRSAFVDREEYQAEDIISCPLPDCIHRWCKTCQQEVQLGAKHTCDGTAELDDLMKAEGWKHCPGCQTPILKTLGCNHMSCITPGCNSHFCYICGEMIIQSASGPAILNAKSAHFTRCQLFEVPPE